MSFSHLIFRRGLLLLSVLLVLLSCAGPPQEIASTSDDRYAVEATRAPGFFGPPTTFIGGRDNAAKDDPVRQLVQLHGMRNDVALRILPNHLLMATIHADSGGCPMYFLVALTSPPAQDFFMFKDRRWADDTTIWVDSSGPYALALARLEPVMPECRFTVNASGCNMDVYILGAKELWPTLVDSVSLSLDIEWINGDTTQGLILKLPEEPSGFIEVSYEGNVAGG